MQNKIKSTLNNFINKFQLLSSFYNKLRKSFNNKLSKLAKKLSNMGISANVVTVVGFIIGMFSINFLSFEYYGYALICIVINRIFDILDGAIARVTKVTKFGVFLDTLFDYIFYSAVIFGFSLARPEANALAASFLLFGFLSVSCAMLAYATIDYNSKEVKKSPFYLDGTIQGGEIFCIIIISCIFPSIFAFIATITGILCIIKALSVAAAAYYNFVIQKNDN